MKQQFFELLQSCCFTELVTYIYNSKYHQGVHIWRSELEITVDAMYLVLFPEHFIFNRATYSGVRCRTIVPRNPARTNITV
jgi:hypothetical protein